MKNDATFLQLLGAGCFGAVIGWYLFFLNRYRAGDVGLGDLVTVVGAIGGAAILALFPAESDLFGAYGIGLAIGFFGYFLVLVGLVRRSTELRSRVVPRRPPEAAASRRGDPRRDRPDRARDGRARECDLSFAPPRR